MYSRKGVVSIKGQIAFIGGTGVYDASFFQQRQKVITKTPYGDVTAFSGLVEGKSVCFMPRHGFDHSIPPHKINYRANIYALKKMGVEKILATAAVGSLNPAVKPGSFFIPDQFIDFTKTRLHTFYEGGQDGVVHTDMTEPYCPILRQQFKKVLNKLKYKGQVKGTYVCTEGPRFETPAEVKMLRAWGGDVVGMTNVPEVVLAREVGLCYAVICIVTNYAAGLAGYALTHQEVLEIMDKKKVEIQGILKEMLISLPENINCNCRQTQNAMGEEK